MKYFGNIITANDQESWTALCGNYIIDSIKFHLEDKGKAILALSGGNSPISIFNYIRQVNLISKEEWENVDFFWIDERIVPFESDQSNAGNAIRALGGINANFYPIDTTFDDPNTIAESYEQLLVGKLKLEDGFPVFDLVLLGMGEDGHIASLFPGTAAIDEENKSVVYNYVTTLNSSRITLTFPVLNMALDTLVIIRGEEKKKVIHELMLGNTNYPIEKILKVKNNRTWFLV